MDALQIKVSDKEILATKRGILSYTRSIFNHLDILSPIILEPKLIIQSLWKKKIDWDEEIPYNLKNRFGRWKENLKIEILLKSIPLKTPNSTFSTILLRVPTVQLRTSDASTRTNLNIASS